MEAAVRCEKCGNQAFCMSCDDMYHRHPRRSAHVRKAVDTKTPTGGVVRPPLPPKGEVPPPQPPPRKNKRAGFLSSTSFSKKDQAYGRPGTVASRSTSMTNLQDIEFDGEEGTVYTLPLPLRRPTTTSSDGSSTGRTIMGSLKRFMGARPLPPTPDHSKGVVSPNQSEAGGTVAVGRPVMRAATSPSLPNLNDHIEEEMKKELPQSVADFNTTTMPHNSVSTPATPTSLNAPYPPLQPKAPQSQPAPQTHSLGRKFSLQQLPQGLEDKRRCDATGC
ncbi:hypothetical protein E2C01_000422 [Portunus trituberculatus]|uniref:Uncharacterized protein n=1 Tax=Portunus trituberculatus TaxID=210409 RepID=A0A5B7CEW7_PORTR|nr:hypothetical protein [Portunus trituberculatus]